MKYSIDQLIQEASNIPPIPRAAQKALELLRDPESNTADLAGILSTDQILAAHMLRRANSAYYGMDSQVVTMQQAIIVLGMNLIQELIMTYAVAAQLNEPVPGYELQRGELWHHALGTAIGAKLISKRWHLQLDEQAYFAGLLCDIGKLIFGKHLQEIDLTNSQWDGLSFLEIERASFGIDHARLGLRSGPSLASS